MRRAQIAVFVIVGLTIALLVSIALIYMGSSTPPQIIAPTVATTPVEEFVEQCVAQVTQEALTLAGHQGGYIDVPQGVPAIAINPTSTIKTPYWYHNAQLLVPARELVEQQINEYIAQRIDVCIDDFAVFENIKITRATVENVQTAINDEDVRVTLNYDIDVQYAQTQRSTDQFVYSLPIPLGSMIDQARTFTQRLNDQVFLEKVTIDLLALADPRIPLTGVDFSCSKKEWKVSTVRAHLEDILQANMARVRVKTAEAFPFQADASIYEQFEGVVPDDFLTGRFASGIPNLPSDIYDYNHLYFDSSQDFNDTLITFSYTPEFGLDMVVRPSEGDIMQASFGRASNLLGFLCFQTYHFTYDVKFPVEVSFIRPNAFADEAPFILKFATPVGVRQNLPDKSDFSSAQPIPSVIDGQLCKATSSFPTQIIVTDAKTSQTLKAHLQYKSYKYACNLGQTGFVGGIYASQVNMPAVASAGRIMATADGYLQSYKDFTGIPEVVTVQLTPLRNVSYKVTLAGAQVPAEYETYITIDHSAYSNGYSYPQQPELVLVDDNQIFNITTLVYDNGVIVAGYIGNTTLGDGQLVIDAFRFDQGSAWAGKNNIDRYSALVNDTAIITNYGLTWE